MPTAKRKTTTSAEVKNRWRAKAYKSYQANLRRDTDADLIEWIEAHKDEYSISDILRTGLDALMAKDT